MAKRIRRSVAARLGAETVEILRNGGYDTPRGRVDLQAWTMAARAGTTNYPGDEPIPTLPPREGHETVFDVRNETTLEAARRMASDADVAALNFASAYHPGGGFLGGARAQEESLARSSALYACLEGQSMYAYHQANRDPMYSPWVIYSPGVPVFRLDSGDLLLQPYRCAFVTSPAVNAKVVLERDPSRAPQVRAAMQLRIDRVLQVAALHHHTTLILGAWGCGVFGNAPTIIAQLFHDALHGRHRGRFRQVVFAVVDWTEDEHIIGPFRAAFGPDAQ